MVLVSGVVFGVGLQRVFITFEPGGQVECYGFRPLTCIGIGIPET